MENEGLRRRGFENDTRSGHRPASAANRVPFDADSVPGVVMTPFGPVYGTYSPKLAAASALAPPPPLPLSLFNHGATVSHQHSPHAAPQGQVHDWAVHPQERVGLLRRVIAESIDVILITVMVFMLGVDLEALVVALDDLTDAVDADEELLVDALFNSFNQVVDTTDEPLYEIAQIMAIFHTQLQLVTMAYQAIFVWMFGATFGKFLMGIQVVQSHDHSRPSLLRCIGRAVFRQLEISITYLLSVAQILRRRRTLPDAFLGLDVIDR